MPRKNENYFQKNIEGLSSRSKKNYIKSNSEKRKKLHAIVIKLKEVKEKKTNCLHLDYRIFTLDAQTNPHSDE